MLEQIADVEQKHGEGAVVRGPRALEQAIRDGRIAFVHCVEGGFHLGRTEEDVKHAVKHLASKGVAYITLAHLIWRDVATNANALPFPSDAEYDRLFPQPHEGLSELGRASVEAMVREGVLIDISH